MGLLKVPQNFNRINLMGKSHGLIGWIRCSRFLCPRSAAVGKPQGKFQIGQSAVASSAALVPLMTMKEAIQAAPMPTFNCSKPWRMATCYATSFFMSKTNSSSSPISPFSSKIQLMVTKFANTRIGIFLATTFLTRLSESWVRVLAQRQV